MWSYLQIIFQNLYDIFIIYLKLALVTVTVYFVAEWYIVHYGIDLNDNEASLLPKIPSNSTVYKVYRFAMDFLIG